MVEIPPQGHVSTLQHLYTYLLSSKKTKERRKEEEEGMK